MNRTGKQSARKGDWVRIHSVVLNPGERAEGLPEDTAAVPLERWEKGFLLSPEAEIGETVKIKTLTGRTGSGELIEISPVYRHGFGLFVPEILEIDRQLLSAMEEIRNEG